MLKGDTTMDPRTESSLVPCKAVNVCSEYKWQDWLLMDFRKLTYFYASLLHGGTVQSGDILMCSARESALQVHLWIVQCQFSSSECSSSPRTEASRVSGRLHPGEHAAAWKGHPGTIRRCAWPSLFWAFFLDNFIVVHHVYFHFYRQDLPFFNFWDLPLLFVGFLIGYGKPPVEDKLI